MNPVLLLLGLLVGVALPVAVTLLVVRRGLRPILVADAYREIGGRLGLVVDTRGTWIRGVVDGRRLWFGDVLEPNGRERYTEIRGILTFRQPLGLGVQIRTLGTADRWVRRGRVQPTGDAKFDSRFELFSTDGVPRTLTAEVRDRLVALAGATREVIVTDDAVFAFLRSAPTRSEHLERVLQAMFSLANAIEVSRVEDVRAAPVDWPDAAADLGLTVTSRPSITGILNGFPVDVVPTRSGDDAVAWVRLTFPHPKDHGFILRTHRHHDDPWTAGQAIDTGDPAFDDAFVVKGYDPEAIRARLIEARPQLMTLHQRGSLAIDDHGLELRGAPMQRDALVAAVYEAFEAVAALGVSPTPPTAA